MAYQPDLTKLSAAPESDDIRLVTEYFNDKCNCYSYAVQDYSAGYITEHDDKDFHYLPRPGQTRGRTYQDLWLSPEGMRRAIHEDGIDFAGMKYPKRIPTGYYVICCFLEPGEYHFIRQNRDGSWSSKDGREAPTKTDSKKNPLINPENYYQGDKKYQFVGYFFVPEGGIRVGVRGYEARRLAALNERVKTPAEQKEKRILTEMVALSDETDRVIKEMRRLFQQTGTDNSQAIRDMWANHRQRLARETYLCKIAGYTRRDVLKDAYTRPKNRGTNTR